MLSSSRGIGVVHIRPRDRAGRHPHATTRTRSVVPHATLREHADAGVAAPATLAACPSRSSPRSTRAARTSRPPPWERCSPGSPARRSCSPLRIRSTSPSTTCIPSTPAPSARDRTGTAARRGSGRGRRRPRRRPRPSARRFARARPSRAAEETDAKLLVIGSSARGPIGRVLPSAVTDRLLHGAPCPVAVAPVGFTFEDAAAGPGLIGVAFTDTPDGHAALAMARALAGRARARVRVLTVAPPLDLLVTGPLDGSRWRTRAAPATRRRQPCCGTGSRRCPTTCRRAARSSPAGPPTRWPPRPGPRAARVRLARLRAGAHAAARRDLPRPGAQGGLPGARRAARRGGARARRQRRRTLERSTP